ncbi:hypothetical protein SOPP22_05755 [Shewanella sp. OPT22]|nr:hypothetical protein SOPP22_05755 [Shewanella sp. OPT22]
MKTKLLGLALLGLATVNLTGCVINVGDGEYDHGSQNWEKKQKLNKYHISLLKLGMSKKAVMDLMGQPDINEAYLTEKKGDQPGSEVQVLFYRTQHNHSDSKTTKDECTPLVIRDGKLVGWGDNAYRFAKF